MSPLFQETSSTVSSFLVSERQLSTFVLYGERRGTGPRKKKEPGGEKEASVKK